MDFVNHYEAFVALHIRKRRGPSKSRLKSGLNHAEKLFLQHVWWPAFGTFDNLHPEYEIADFNDGYRYIDFAFIHPHFKIAIEIDGIGSHWKDITQWQFSDHCNRQNHLTVDGWHILRFAYIDVKEHPRLCQQIVQQLMGRLSSHTNGHLNHLHPVDKEIIRLVMNLHRPITARDVMGHLQLSTNTATRHLRHLAEIEWLEAASGLVRIRSYQLHMSRTHLRL